MGSHGEKSKGYLLLCMSRLKNQKDVEKRNSLLQFLFQQYRGDNDVTSLISKLYCEHDCRSKSAKFTRTTKRLQNRTTQEALDRYERDHCANVCLKINQLIEQRLNETAAGFITLNRPLLSREDVVQG